MRGSARPDAVAPALGAALEDVAPAVPEPLELPCDGAGVELPEEPLPPLLVDLLPLCGLARGSVYWLSPALWARAAAGTASAQIATTTMSAIRFIAGIRSRQRVATLVAVEEHELRELLLRWDPIGVANEPGWPQDEYDVLLDPLAERLREGASEQELTAFLESAVREHLGLEPDREREAALARELAGWHARGNAPDP